MSEPTFHGVFATSSAIRTALGDALSRIRQEDRLTWADMGDILGKSEDQVAKYADGSATMDAATYYRGKAVWNGRFTGAADQLLHGATKVEDLKAQSHILRASLALSLALEDGKLTTAEIRAARSDLECARDAIDALLSRLTPKAAA